MNFGIGDRVVCILPFEHFPHAVGLEGTVIAVGPKKCEGYKYAVQFDIKFKQGHSCLSRCPNGTGRYFNDGFLNYLSAFRVGDIIQIGTETIKVTKENNVFTEKEAILLSRKQLI